MRQWKAEYDAKLRATVNAPTDAPSAPAPATGNAASRSTVMQELELAKHEKEGGVDAPRA